MEKNLTTKGNTMEQRSVKKELKRFLQEEDGIGVVEVILILVVLIALVAIFKTKLTTLVKKIFKTINAQAGKI